MSKPLTSLVGRNILLAGGVLIAAGSGLALAGFFRAYSVVGNIDKVSTVVADKQLAAARWLAGLGIVAFWVGLFVGAFGLAIMIIASRDDQ